MGNKDIITSEFKISFDNDFISRQFGVTSKQAKLLKELAIRIHGKVDKMLIRKLDKLSKEHPNLPQLRNYMSAVYNQIGQYAKSVEINELLLIDFPNYLHAKINAANHCFFEGKPEKALKYLGVNLDLKELYPERNEFHFTEVQAFYYTTVLYAIVTEDLDLAENRFEFYKSIDPENPRIEELEDRMDNLRLLQRLEKKDNLKHQFGHFSGRELPFSATTNLPLLNHPEVYRLYELGCKNSVPELMELLDLPKDTLIQDLELVLQDAVERYQYFIELDWRTKTHSFLHHAIFLLAELNAESSLPKILEILSYDEEFLDLYFGDFLTENIWIVLYRLGENQVHLLEQFLYEKEVYTFSKSAISNALTQIVAHYPERKNEIQTLYQKFFDVMIVTEPKDKTIDPTFLGLAIGDTAEIFFEDLLPQIEKLYANGLVDEMIEGNFEVFRSRYYDYDPSNFKKELSNLESIYQNTFFSEEDDDEYEGESFLENYESKQQAVRTVKIGRNDPCPCGNGKKYKKCCGK